ncbi:MAG: hypothetical protein KKF68_01540 [Nanoarchaeota archaeon]|nr:hypothetical protein [Nanoarchaeota archaeon]
MDFENMSELMAHAFAGGIIGSLFVIGIFLAVLLIAAIYIYVSMAWMTIGKKT